MKRELTPGMVRRSFLSRIAAGAGAFGAAFTGGSALAAQATPAATGRFTPARHAEDDWFDQTTAAHRVFYDTTNSEGLGQALAFARNYFTANASGYKLADADLAQILCMRHRSTPFGFNDAMWRKYGAALSARDGLVDPKTKQAPTINIYMADGDATIDELARRGVRFAVCSMATRAAAGRLAAQKTGGNADDIFKELTENLVPNAHMVPAGIVAVNRAQEHGYTLVSVA